MFEPYMKSFYVRSTDPTHIKTLKVRALLSFIALLMKRMCNQKILYLDSSLQFLSCCCIILLSSNFNHCLSPNILSYLCTVK